MAATVSGGIDAAQLEAWKGRAGGDVDRYTATQADAIATTARQLAPSRSGALARTIGAERARDVAGRFAPGWTVVATAPYSLFVHEGTRPHPIVARRAPALVFYWERVGAVVAFVRVNHPGTNGQPFLVDAVRRVIA